MEGFTNHLIAKHYSLHRKEMQPYFIATLHNHSVKKNP